MAQARLHIKVYGIVQGVFFRSNTKKQARKLSLTGWIKNNPDATVEIIAEGKKSNLNQLIRWCQKGPDAAQVNRLEKEWQEYNGKFKGFTIRY